METLDQLTDAAEGGRTLEELARPLLEMLQTVTGLESAYLTTVDLARGTQHVLFASNSREMQIPEGMTIEWDQTLCRRAMEERCAYTDDVAGRWGDVEAARALGINTYTSTAVRTDSGALYGTLCAASSDKVPMTPQTEHVLGMFSALISQHVERERAMSDLRSANTRLASLARTDALTGLPNRRALLQELARLLARASRKGSLVHVAFIDLDGFKAINDTHGHEIGDRFLVAMAQRLASGLRADDLIARLGGDEFVVAAEGIDSEQSARMLRDRLAARTAARFELDGIVIDYPGASVGVVSSGPDPVVPEDLLILADAEMYRIKRERRRHAPPPAGIARPVPQDEGA